MLTGYDGTLLLVSHDRYLLNAVTNKTLGFTGDGGALQVEGNYAAWREAREAQTAPPPVPPKAKVPVLSTPAVQTRSNGTSPASSFGNSKARVKAAAAVEKAERTVQAREAALAEVEAKLASGDGDMVALAAEHTRVQAEVDAAVAVWEAAVAEQEALG